MCVEELWLSHPACPPQSWGLPGYVNGRRELRVRLDAPSAGKPGRVSTCLPVTMDSPSGHSQ